MDLSRRSGLFRSHLHLSSGYVGGSWVPYWDGYDGVVSAFLRKVKTGSGATAA